jgi:ADP-ribose pyrophosphatase YjhB (NUDIX family)
MSGIGPEGKEETARSIVATIVLSADRRVLLGFKKKDRQAGVWTLPISPLQKGESPVSIGLNQIWEKVGIVVSKNNVLAKTKEVADGTIYNVLVVRKEGAPPYGERLMSGDVIEWLWFPLPMIPRVQELTPISRKVLWEFKEGKSYPDLTR